MGVVSPLQTAIMRKSIDNPLFAKEILPKTPLSIFDGNEAYKEISAIIKRYYQSHKDRLNEETLLTLAEDKLDRMKKSPEEKAEYFNAIKGIYDIRNFKDDDVIDEQIEKSIKKAMYKDLLMKAAVNLDNDKFMDKVADDWRLIMMMDVSGKVAEIINVIDDVEYKKSALATLYTNVLSTGFRAIDALNGGGLAKGELGLVVAASGTGKTMVLTNLTTNYVRSGKNVLFIALEELENRMILKFEQSMLRQAKSTILNGSVLNEENYDKMQEFYKKNRAHFGNLFFARYSPRTVTPAKIEQLISDVKLRMGIELDVVVIDYPDLLRLPQGTGNESQDGGYLYEEMRRIGQDYNVIMWTASQMNRTAYAATIRTAEHMEGSLRKKNAAELVLTVNQSPEEYNAGFIRLYADKVRNPPEGAYDRMVGLKVIGSSNTIRDYRDNEAEMHQQVLDELENNMSQMFKSRKKENKAEAPDYANEINASIQRTRGGE